MKGYVSVDDAVRILRELRFSDKEIIALVTTHDTNKEGKLQYSKICPLLE